MQQAPLELIALLAKGKTMAEAREQLGLDPAPTTSPKDGSAAPPPPPPPPPPAAPKAPTKTTTKAPTKVASKGGPKADGGDPL